MLEILKYCTSDLWVFIGCFSLINLSLFFIVNGIVRIISRFIRLIIILSKGYPPANCDADGDFLPKS
jgi:hypothetical protein